MEPQTETNYRICFLDIETAPLISHTWGTWDQNVIHVERDWYIMSYAVKWLGEKTIHSKILPDYPLYKKDPFDDSELVKDLWDVFNEADLIIAHNGDKFDIKKTYARFILNGMNPPRPGRTYDTLKIAKKVAAFTSNKLDNLCQRLGIGQKLRHEGYELWLGCLKEDMKWWNKMRKYNIHDVKLLEGLYYKLRAWDPTHPNITLSTGKAYLCPVCGSNKTISDGPRYLKTYTADRYYCKACHHYSTGARRKIPVPVLT